MLRTWIVVISLMIPIGGFACPRDSFCYLRQSTWGLQSGSGIDLQGDTSTNVTVPVFYEGGSGSYRRTSKLKVEVQQENGNRRGFMSVEFPEVHFQNLPRARVETYFQLSGIPKANFLHHLPFARLEVVSFVCAANAVLAMETYSGQLREVGLPPTPRGQSGQRFSVFIATGEAAANLKKRMRKQSFAEQLPLGLAQSFAGRYKGPQEVRPSLDWRTPNILVHSSENLGPGHFYYKLDSRNPKNIGCTEGFRKSMEAFHVDRAQDAGFPKYMSVKSDAKGVLVEWDDSKIYDRTWEVLGQRFRNEFPKLLAHAFCDPRGYFVQCFPSQARFCNQSVEEMAKTCLAGEQVPNTLQQPQDGRDLGESVGACAGTAFEYEHQSQKLDAENCRSPNYWML